MRLPEFSGDPVVDTSGALHGSSVRDLGTWAKKIAKNSQFSIDFALDIAESIIVE